MPILDKASIMGTPALSLTGPSNLLTQTIISWRAEAEVQGLPILGRNYCHQALDEVLVLTSELV